MGVDLACVALPARGGPLCGSLLKRSLLGVVNGCSMHQKPRETSIDHQTFAPSRSSMRLGKCNPRAQAAGGPNRSPQAGVKSVGVGRGTCQRSAQPFHGRVAPHAWAGFASQLNCPC